MADASPTFWRHDRHDARAPAVYDPHAARWCSYGELWDLVDDLAGQLRDDTKRLVFLRCGNDLATVTGYLASLAAGHAVALLDRGLDGTLRDALEQAYAPDLVLERDGPAPLPGRRATEAAGGAVHPDTALLLSTSGTTGSPKFARLSLANVAANARSIVAALGIGEQDIGVASLPLHYSYGLSLLNTHLAAGARLVLTEAPLLSEDFWQAVRRHACTSLAGVPYSYQMLRRLDLGALDVPALTVLTQAGGKLGNDLILEFHGRMAARGGRFYVMYGQTEATARISVLPAELLPDRVGSVGYPVPGGVITVDTGDGPAAPDGEGEIVYRGPNVMLGYAFDRAGLAAGDAHGGTLRTGDLGRVDADGLLYLTGRSTRIAKVFGLRVNLEEVEAQARRWGPAAAVGGPDRVVIFAEGAAGHPLDERARALARLFRINHRAIVFRPVDRLPLLASGKIDYRALQADA
jgi:acyl-CoA synthetase (AMP-forming)/AMP-acid ligase II